MKNWLVGCHHLLEILTITCAILQSSQGYHRRRFNRNMGGEPIFLKTNNNITVYKGQTAHLKCKIKNLGTKTVQWRRVEERSPLTIGKLTFTQRDEVSIRADFMADGISVWTLVIKQTKPSDSGSYECKISAKQEFIYVVHLQVKDESIENTKTDYEYQDFWRRRQQSKKSIWLSGTEYVNLRQMINLTCNATGLERAPEHIDWFHDGHIIHQSDAKWKNRLHINYYQPEVPGRSLISQLVIAMSTSSDGGNYICRSSEKETTSMNVHVLNANKENIDKRNEPITSLEIQEVSGQSNSSNIFYVHFLLLFLAFLLSLT